MAQETKTDQELRWARIEKTRKIDKATGRPEVGSHGKAFLRWHNSLVDRILVMHKDDNWNVMVQRLQGGQMITVPIDALRTLDEVLESLKKNYPEHYPVTETTRKEINPAILPTGVINKIWNIT